MKIMMIIINDNESVYRVAHKKVSHYQMIKKNRIKSYQNL